MFMKQIFIKVVLMLRFEGLAGFGYRRQRRTLGESDMSPETMRTKSGVHFTVNSVARNGSFRNGFKSFAETFSKEHYRSAGISERFAGISGSGNTNPRRVLNFRSLYETQRRQSRPDGVVRPPFFRCRFRHCLKTFVLFGGAHDLC